MNQQNLVVIEGNACRDAEIKTTASGAIIGKMSIASNRFYKSGDGFEKEVSFFDVDCFGEVARLCGEKVRKGNEIRVTGRLKQSRWQHEGQSRSAFVIVAERVEFKAKLNGGENKGTSEPESARDDIPF
jgi:single-strand DNA-binding protein